MSSQEVPEVPELWREHTTWKKSLECIMLHLQKGGVLVSKAPEGAQKKKITNIWFDEATQEIVVEHE